MFKWFKRFLIATVVLIVALLVLVFIFISPIAKYLIHKYDKEFTNREIVIDGLWINILSGYAGISGLTVYEEHGTDKFFTCKKIEVKISTTGLLQGEYNLKRLTFIEPKVKITMLHTGMNYDDIIRKFSDSGKKDQPATEPVKWQLNNLTITKGTVTFSNRSVDLVNVFKKINFHLPALAWNTETIAPEAALEVESGGQLKLNGNYNLTNNQYNLKLDLRQFNLRAWYPYLRDLMQTKALEGILSMDMHVTGNSNTTEEIALKGKLNLDELKVVDPLDKTLLAVKQIELHVDTINVVKGLYRINDVTINEPYFVYEMYNEGSNFDRLMEPETTSVSDTTETEYSNLFTLMLSYITDISKNYAVTNYSSNRFEVNNAHFIFNDFTLHNQFNLDFTNFNMLANNLRSGNESIEFKLNGTMNKSGIFSGDLKMDPMNFENIDLTYSVNDLRITDFNPYTLYYVAFPFQEGVIQYTGNTRIYNRQLKSENDLKILAIELGSKVPNKTAYKLPMKLAIALLRDNKGDIKLKIPVEGNLDDPKYKIGKIIWQILKNIIVKAASAPYKLIAGFFDGNEEDLKQIHFDYQQPDLTEKQYKQLDLIAKALEKKPELSVELTQVNNRQAEKEFIALYGIKQLFYKTQNPGVVVDSTSETIMNEIKSIEIHDQLFKSFVDEKSPLKNNLVSTQEKAIATIGSAEIDELIMRNAEKRNHSILNYLTIEKKINPSRVKVKNTADQASADLQQVSKFLIRFYADEDDTTMVEKTE